MCQAMGAVEDGWRFLRCGGNVVGWCSTRYAGRKVTEAAEASEVLGGLGTVLGDARTASTGPSGRRWQRWGVRSVG